MELPVYIAECRRFYTKANLDNIVQIQIYPYQFEGTEEEFRNYCINTLNAVDAGCVSNDEFISGCPYCYTIINGVVKLDINKYKEKRKNDIRLKRETLFKQLDTLYFIESEKIYENESFKKTPEMDEIMRKKKLLRDLPQQLDLLTTIEEVRNFVIPQTLEEL